MPRQPRARHQTPPAAQEKGFTLTELMIVVSLIGMLAALCIPAANRMRERGTNGRFVSDMRTAKFAFIQYSLEVGVYPEDTSPAQLPDGMRDYLRRFDWRHKTALGGYWDWDKGQFGYKAGVSVYHPTAPLRQLRDVDKLFDDGSLTTGDFLARPDGYISVIEN